MRDFPEPATGSDHLAETFKTGSALVAAAMGALEGIAATLAEMRTVLASPSPRALLPSIARLYRLVKDAAVGADNLLVAPPAHSAPVTLRVVGREPSGAVDVRTLEIDREALALVGRGDRCDQRPLDRLADAVRIAASRPSDEARRAAIAALDQLGNRVAIGSSRLSLVKARLDLQESFLTSVLAADPSLPVTRIDGHLDQTTARDLARAAGRLLNRRSLTIASGNRAVLSSLLRAEPEAGH